MVKMQTLTVTSNSHLEFPYFNWLGLYSATINHVKKICGGIKLAIRRDKFLSTTAILN